MMSPVESPFRPQLNPTFSRRPTQNDPALEFRQVSAFEGVGVVARGPSRTDNVNLQVLPVRGGPRNMEFPVAASSFFVS